MKNNLVRTTERLIVSTTLLLYFLASPIFAAESAEASPNEPPKDAVLGEFPFERPEEPNRVYIDLAPEGRPPFIMLLDTGANTSVITPLMARKMKISVRRLKNSPYRRKTSLGRDVQFWVDTQTSDTGSKTGWEYGVLGGDFLDDYVVEIDFPGRRVRFLDPKKYAVPKTTVEPDTAIVPLKHSGTRFTVPIELDGKPLWVLFDTGAPMGLIVSGKALRKIGLGDVVLEEFAEIGTTLGSMETKRYEAQKLRLGTFDFTDFPVLVAPKGAYNIAGTNDSILGYDAMAPFIMRIDYKRKRIWLERKLDLDMADNLLD